VAFHLRSNFFGSPLRGMRLLVFLQSEVQWAESSTCTQEQNVYIQCRLQVRDPYGITKDNDS
jgi:hypothetical protein